jgi:hypothetical protein
MEHCGLESIFRGPRLSLQVVFGRSTERFFLADLGRINP